MWVGCGYVSLARRPAGRAQILSRNDHNIQGANQQRQTNNKQRQTNDKRTTQQRATTTNCNRDGGTIPALAYFQSILNVPSTVFAFGLGERIHAPNERLKLAMFDLGSEAYVRMLAELGRGGKAAFAARDGGGKAGGGGEAAAGHEEL